MTKHHYVYHSYEEWGREYIGIRSCDCLPEEDTKYFGSFCDKSFKPTGKTILFVCEKRIEASEIEIELHDFFDVAVNPQFANKAKATSTGFDRAGVIAGPHTEAQNKAKSERMTGKFVGEKHPMYGVPNSEEQKKTHSERMSGEKNPNYGNTGALSPCSKAIIAIKPDGTELYFDSIIDATKELGIDGGSLCGKYLKTGKSPKWGRFKGWQFRYVNPVGVL